MSGLISCISLSSHWSCLFQEADYGLWDKEKWLLEHGKDEDLQQIIKVLTGQSQSMDSNEAKILLRQ